MFLCFSPSSPVPSAKANSSSEIPSPLSAPLKVKEENTETLTAEQTCLKEDYESPQITTTKRPTLKPINIVPELKHDSIPTLNIIPSSPLPSSLNPQEDTYESIAECIDKVQKKIDLLKSGFKPISNRADNSDSQQAHSKPNKPESDNCSDPSNKLENQTETQAASVNETAPVIMKIEHINENESSASNLQASQQFPVVTRRFRQLKIYLK